MQVYCISVEMFVCGRIRPVAEYMLILAHYLPVYIFDVNVNTDYFTCSYTIPLYHNQVNFVHTLDGISSKNLQNCGNIILSDIKLFGC